MRDFINSFVKICFILTLGCLLYGNTNAQSDTSLNPIDSVVKTEDFSEMLNFDEILSQEESLNGIKRQEPFVGGWFFVLNIVLILLLLLKYLLFNDYTRKSWNAWVNKNLFFQLVREKTPINFIVLIIETFIKLYILAVLFFLIKYAWFGNWEFTFKQFSNLALILLVFFSIKYFITFLLTIVADQVEEYKSFGLNNIVFFSNIAWFIIPALLIAIYSNLTFRSYLVYAILGIAFIALVAYLYKCITVALKMKIKFNVHFFIYLCAFEILPYLFLGKTILNLNFIK